MDNFHGQFFSHDFLLHSGYTLLVISESVSYGTWSNGGSRIGYVKKINPAHGQLVHSNKEVFSSVAGSILLLTFMTSIFYPSSWWPCQTWQHQGIEMG